MKQAVWILTSLVILTVLAVAAIATAVAAADMVRSRSPGTVRAGDARRARAHRHASGGGKIGVVVARYAEPCRWLLKLPYSALLPHTIIYNKGDDDLDADVAAAVGGGVVALPNVGRCDHTYLWHIVRGAREGSLSDITLFLPGSLPDSVAKTKSARSMVRLLLKAAAVLRAADTLPPRANARALATALEGNILRAGRWRPVNVRQQEAGFQLANWTASTSVNAKRNPESRLLPADVRPFGAWFDFMFGAGATARGPYLLGGVIAGSRKAIEQTPIAVWEELLRQVGKHSNPEVGHYIERVWGTLLCGTIHSPPTPGAQ